MPHGGPDWSTGGQISTVHTIEDLGELAARLGSIVTHDRRGNVIWYDDFESGIEAWAILGSPGYTITWDSTHHKSGGFACKMVTGNDANDFASITTHLAIPVISKLGFEIAITKEDNIKEIEIRSDTFSAVHVYYVRVKWVAASDTWYYYNSAGGWTALTPTQALLSVDYLFNVIKLVADPIASKYVRLIVNEQPFDLSGLALRVIGPIANIEIVPAVKITTNADAVATVWVDNAIVTQNEI